MKAIFDTCALFDDLPMTGLSSQTILGQAKRGKFELVMPEVVYLEMVNKMRERIETAVGKMKSGADSLKKVGVGEGVDPPQHNPLTKQFADNLKERITASGKLVPIPDLGHDQLVVRSLQGLKPFRTSGVGYRDALIWQTVLDQVEEDDVVFISGNSKDFAENGDLHPDLQAEVAQRNHSVTLLTNVEEFLEQYVPPADQALTKAQQLLLDDDAFKVDLEKEVFDQLINEDKWPYHSQVALVPNRPVGLLSEDPQLVSVDFLDLFEIEIEDAIEFDPEDETAVLTISVKAELTVDLLFDQGDAYWLIESNAGVSFYDMDYNEAYAAGQSVIYARGELQALFKDGQIEQLEIISLEDLPADDFDHPASGGRPADSEALRAPGSVSR